MSGESTKSSVALGVKARLTVLLTVPAVAGEVYFLFDSRRNKYSEKYTGPLLFPSFLSLLVGTYCCKQSTLSYASNKDTNDLPFSKAAIAITYH